MPNDNNAMPVQFVVPRITIIAGLDSLGNVYLTLSQANSNSDSMTAFFHHLAAKLDNERPGWRRTTILLLDNAKYHNSDQTMKVFRQLRLPICFFGPNSYDTAVCELLFASLKVVDLNKDRLQLGKK